MKKFLAMMLAVLMLLSMATVAMAEDLGTPSNQNGDGWNKGYFAPGDSFDLKLAYENASSAPTETFNFKIDSVSNAPQITTYTKTVTNTTGAGLGNDKISITLPQYTAAGKYEYTITQTAPTDENKTKGVEYDTAARTMIVYVENYEETKDDGTTEKKLKCQVAVKNGENKSDTFNNKYKMGTLKITKKVDSAVGADKSTKYNFTISLSNVNNVDYTGVVFDANDTAVTGASNVTISGTTEATFTLQDGQSLKIEHLPAGASYTVKETKPSVNTSHEGEVTVKYGNTPAEYDEDSTTSTNAATGSITENEIETATIENNFEYKGSLVISKIVAGNLGDMVNDEFVFTITIDKEFTSEDIGSKLKNTEGNTYTATLKHGESVTLKDIPYGAEYTVTETKRDDYKNVANTLTEKLKGGTVDGTTDTKEKNTRTGKIDHTTEELVFTNTNQQEIPTGVSLDTLPYVLVLALAGAGLVLMIARKRRVQD